MGKSSWKASDKRKRDRSQTTTQKAIEEAGRKATIYTADLSSQAEVAALTPAILKDGHKIHILVNCAGIQRRHPSEQFPDNDWNEVSYGDWQTSINTDKICAGLASKLDNSFHTLQRRRCTYAWP